MSISGIIDQTFKLYRSNFKDIILFSLLIGGTASLIAALFQLGTNAASMETLFGSMLNGQSLLDGLAIYSVAGSSNLFASMLSLVSSLFVTPFVYGGITSITLDFTHGASDGAQLPKNLPRYGKYLGTWLAMVVVMILLIIILIIILSIIIAIRIYAVVILVWIVAIVAFLVFSMIFVFAYPVAIQENRYGFAWFGRARKLFGRKKAKTIGLVLLTGILVYALTLVVESVFTLFLPPLFSAITNVLISSLLMPVPIIAWTLLYLDIRITTEGYDLEIRVASMNDELGLNAPAERVYEAPDKQEFEAPDKQEFEAPDKPYE